jgi:preprotein translocase subunit SecD
MTRRPPCRRTATDGAVRPLRRRELASANVGSTSRAADGRLRAQGERPDLFARWTAAHINQYFAIVLDNVVISAPGHPEAIPAATSRSRRASVGFAKAEADELVNVLRLRLAAVPGRGARERHDSTRRSARSSSRAACSPARSQSCS